MVQRAKKRFLGLFSLIFGSILALFTGAKSLQAQSDANPGSVDLAHPSAWSDIKTVAPSKAYRFHSPDAPQSKPGDAMPVTQPSDNLSAQQAPTKMAVRNQGTPSGTFPSQAMKIHQNDETTTPANALEYSQPRDAIKAQRPSQGYAFFERPSAAYKAQVGNVEESNFENWLNQQGFQAQNLSNIELDAAYTDFRLEQIERRLDQLDIER